MGGPGTATVVIAHHDPQGRELMARIVEAMGQNAIRSDAGEPSSVVDLTVSAAALVVVLDISHLGLTDLAEVIDTLATRRYPAQVVALVDGAASAARAGALGAAVTLERPFHRHEFEAALTTLLGLDASEPVTATVDAAESPADDDAAGPADDTDTDIGAEAGGPSESGDPASAEPAGEHPGSDQPAVEDSADEPAPEKPTADEPDDAPPDASTEPPAREDLTESSGAEAERTPVATKSRDSASSDSFTDILRMGRQL